jgi:hypothetical protein
MHTPLPRTSTDEERRAHYDAVMASITSLLEDETDGYRRL